MKPLQLRSGTIQFGRGPVVLVHGGAWDIPEAETESHLTGMQAALAIGRDLLTGGAPALDVVEACVASMEDAGVFDAGRGSVLTRGGFVEMDAGLMRGQDLAFGSVASVRTVRHPIHGARAVLDGGEGQVRLLVGSEADSWLHAMGIEGVRQEDLVHPRERARWEQLRAEAAFHTSKAFQSGQAAPRGTVGCVARDQWGHLAAATSTGGTPFRPEGRVGDSPLPGCGFYADLDGAASATGWGEAIAAAGLSGRVVEAVGRGTPPETAVRDELVRMGTRISGPDGRPAAAGMIAMGSGEAAWGFTTPRMARGAWSTGRRPWVKL